MRAYERLLKYISYSTTSDEDNENCPSTDSQFILAKVIVEEMKSIGIEDACVDEHCYVYGTIEATPGMEQLPVIGLIAHMDTAPAYNGNGITPRIIENYDGNDITLNATVMMRISEYPELRDYVGGTLIVTDGTTLLGADDKAGISEIMTAADRIIRGKIPHGRIRIAFTPDEEIGRGADLFDVKGFAADYAYTVDGGALGELEYENFNAAAAHIVINGNCIHPGEGKNKMKNAALIAMRYNSLLPENETPAHTEGYEGFYHLTDIKGNEERTTLNYIVRDHDRELFEKRKAAMREACHMINKEYGDNTCELTLEDSYYNMKEMILPHMEIIDRAVEAMKACEVVPKIVPIRGGTDGARLSYMGLPCPNLSTGGHNFHGKYEYIPAESMDKMVDVIVKLVTCD